MLCEFLVFISVHSVKVIRLVCIQTRIRTQCNDTHECNSETHVYSYFIVVILARRRARTTMVAVSIAKSAAKP